MIASGVLDCRCVNNDKKEANIERLVLLARFVFQKIVVFPLVRRYDVFMLEANHGILGTIFWNILLAQKERASQHQAVDSGVRD